ncbi:MAG: DUF2085 domain-containing protein [Rhodothermales bacterium]|nr:DUF2085 domain-containing protein [Rhodothermales bacterium]
METRSAKKLTGNVNKAVLAWAVAFGVTLFVLVLGVLPPFVDEPFRGFLMSGFSSFCHQIPTRSFHVDGVQLALCHRCLGIYAGLPIAVVAFLGARRWDGFLSSRARYFILASLVPLGLDWLLDFLGIWSNTALSRLFTGSLFGLTAGYYLARGIVSIGTSPDTGSASSADRNQGDLLSTSLKS